MVILFYTLIMLALIHFSYERILAPSFRLSLRYDLFALRDKLRNLRKETSGELNESIYQHIQSSINNLISFLPFVDVFFIAKAEKVINQDEKLKQKINVIVEELDNCAIEEIQSIRWRSKRIFVKTLLVNNGMLFLYFFPLVIIAFLLKALVARIVNAIQEWIYIPELELNKINPSYASSSQYY